MRAGGYEQNRQNRQNRQKRPNRQRRTRIGVVVGGMLCVLALAFALSGCGGGSSSSAKEVTMGVAAFQQTSVSIKVGQAIHFVDPASGGTHVICVGEGVQCVPQSGAPAELNTTDGMAFNTGDSRDIVFPTAGTYHIVCIIHPGMEVVVTVS